MVVGVRVARIGIDQMEKGMGSPATHSILPLSNVHPYLVLIWLNYP